ncbi:hypothetical protein D3C72_1626980 [compost metagenome]
MAIGLEAEGRVIGRGELASERQLPPRLVLDPQVRLPAEQPACTLRANLSVVRRRGALQRSTRGQVEAAFQVEQRRPSRTQRLIAAHAPARTAEVALAQFSQALVPAVVVRVADHGVDQAVDRYGSRY